MNRRQALLGLGGGFLGWMVHSRLPAALPASASLEDLATRVSTTTREGVFDVAAQAIRNGATPEALIGAAFLAGVREIRPRSVGSKLHAVMMVESAFQLLEALPPRERWLAAFWTLADCKRSQARDVRQGDWRLPPRPKVSFTTEAAARRELLTALETWDDERADRAVVGLLEYRSATQVFDLLWPAAARSYTDIGHKIIFATQVRRAVERIGEEAAEDALRSLIHGLLYMDRRGRRTESFELAQERLRAFPEGWKQGKEDPAKSVELLRQLRGTTPPEAMDLVLAAFRSGLGPATVWDGLRLYGTELFHRRPREAARRHAPVHPVTELNAFHYLYRTTEDEELRRLAILQTAGWMPLLREDLIGFLGPMREGAGTRVDSLGAAVDGPLPSLEESLEEPAPGPLQVRLAQAPGNPTAYLARLRSLLMTRAFQNHQYKFLAALHEETAHIHPRWAPHLLAPAVTYLPTAVDPETETYRRSIQALRLAGVG